MKKATKATPERARKIQMNFRLDENLIAVLHENAEREHRTITQVVELALIEYFQNKFVSMPGVKIPGILEKIPRSK